VKARLSSAFLLILAFALPAWCAPPSPDRMLEAQKLIVTGQLDAAEKMIVSEMMLAPQDVNWITLLAELRLDQNRPQEALKLLDDADRLGGVTAPRAILASRIVSVMGRLDLAEKQLRTAIRLDPSNPVAPYFLARVLYTDNRFDESIEESNKAISLSPGNVRAYENLGLCYEGKNDPKTAEHWYLEAIRRETTSGSKTEWPMLDLATMMIRQNRYAEAKPYLEQALEINPHNAQSLFQMGILLEKTEDPNGALEKYRAAIQNDPRLAGAYYRAARLCKKLGYADEAAQDFDKFNHIHEQSQNQP
jgi:tetratricopeptide (TPR) repeat protein